MDPVKEKLSLLKKLANEKKANQNANNSSSSKSSNNNENINKNKNNNNNTQESGKLGEESSSSSSAVALAGEDNSNSISSNIISSSTNEAAVREEKTKGVNTSTNKNPSGNKLNTAGTVEAPGPSEGEDTAADDNSLVAAFEHNSKSSTQPMNQSNSDSSTTMNSSKAVKTEPTESTVNPSSASKYINRIKHLYDRERASSTESIHSARQPLPASPLVSLTQRKKAILSPQSSVRTGDEINSLISDQDDSIMSTSTANNAPARSNKYIKHLRDTFNSGLVPSRSGNESPNENKRNSIGDSAISSAQIDRIKEKFAKLNNKDPFQTALLSKRHSMMFGVRAGSQHPERTPIYTNYLNSAMSKSLKSLNTIDAGDLLGHGSTMSMSMSSNRFSPTTAEEATLLQNSTASTNSSSRPLHKYQKSITCDLSSYILGNRDSDSPPAKKEDTKSMRTTNDSDYDSLFDRLNADAKYTPENAIIRSTMSSGSRATNKPHTVQDQIVPTIVTTEATPTSNPQTPFAFPPVSSANQPGPLKPIGPRAGGPQPPVKSILKSPSTTSEKSIHFDDHIDVIQIEDRLSTATSSPPSLSQPSSDLNQMPNLDLFKPLKGISQTEMAKNMLLQQQHQQMSKSNLAPPQSRFSNEIEAIKKMLLEPVSNRRVDAADTPDFVRMRSAGSARSRVFIKSPTPMRELPEFENTSNKAFTEQDVSGNNKNRNRFAKKKLPSSLRSQSVDLKESLAEANDEIMSPVPSSIVSRPNLTRQNAFARGNANTTKSLSENLNFAHYYQSPPKSVSHHHHHDPSKPPKSSSRLLGKSGHKHSRKKSSKKSHRHRHHRNKRLYERSSSLTDSSQSEHSESESSSSESVSSDERARAHSDSFISSSATSLDDLAQLNNEVLVASGGVDQLHTGDRMLPPKQKKRTPVFNVFNGARLSTGQRGKKHGVSGSHLNRHTFYSSDDSVCGIPKSSSKLASSRLCSSGKSFHKSMDELGYNRETIPKATTTTTTTTTTTSKTSAGAAAATASTLATSNHQQQATTNLKPSASSNLNNNNPMTIMMMNSGRSRASKPREHNEPEKYPSFDDQDSHLSRNPPSASMTKSDLYFKPSNNEGFNSTPVNRAEIIERKISTDSAKSDPMRSQKKPLPSYNQIVQANPNGFQFYNQQQQRNPASRYDNNIGPITATNSYMNGLYSLHDPNQQRITQPYQHNLVANQSQNPREQYGQAAAYMSPPRTPPSYHQAHQHLSMPPNESMIAFQNSRSRSLDASMYYDANNNFNTEVLSKYGANDIDIGETTHQRSQLDDYIRQATSMPSQSLAIQEKLKMFEQPTSPPPAPNSSVFANEMAGGRKTKQAFNQQHLPAASSPIQQYSDQIPSYSTKRVSYETSANNKENSPYNYRMSMNPSVPATLPSQQQRFNYYQAQSPQTTGNRNTIAFNPSTIDSKYSMMDEEPTQLQRVSPPKPPSNYKYGSLTNQFTVPNAQKSTSSLNSQQLAARPGYINPNLAAATAAAAAALSAATGANPQQYHSFDYGTGASRSKMMRQDNFNLQYPPPTVQQQHSFNDGVSVSSQNMNDLSIASNKHLMSTNPPDQPFVKEKSIEKQHLIRHQTPTTATFAAPLQIDSSIDFPKKRVLNDATTPITRHQTNSITFSKSSLSPTKHLGNTQMNTTIDDIEMLSSSPSSTSSLKEAIKQKQTNGGRLQPPQGDMTMSSISGQTTSSSVVSSAPTSSPSSTGGGKLAHRRSHSNEIELDHLNEDENGEEPSKLSLSEKMKLFSNSSTSAGLRPKLGVNIVNGHSSVSHKHNRYQTQPVSSADLDYANTKLASNNNSSKFLTSIENNIHMINSKNSSTPTTTTTTTPKLIFDNNTHNNIQQPASNFNKRFVDPENNAISAKTINLAQKQQHQFDSILNDNQSDSSSNQVRNSNKMSAANNDENSPEEQLENTKTDPPPQLQQREPKRYKFKSKTDFIGKPDEPVEINENEEANENSRPVGTGEPTTVAALEIGMTIQERVAALKKIGEDNWKRRAANEQAPAPINVESSQPNIVKQQKEQLQLQLKQIHQNPKSKPLTTNTSDIVKSGPQRHVLSTLDDNNQQDSSDKSASKPPVSGDHELFMSKKALIEKRVLFTPPDSAGHHIRLTKPTPASESINLSTSAAKKQPNRVLKHSASSDTDTMFTRNASIVTGNTPQIKNERVELFSTDSEMDSFFKENENILNSQNFLSSSSTTGGSKAGAVGDTRTDDNTLNESFDDVEFDRIAAEANRLTQRTRAKPSRKAKSKGNHLKNLQNRIEIKNEYEQNRVPIVGTRVSPSKSNFNN